LLLFALTVTGPVVDYVVATVNTRQAKVTGASGLKQYTVIVSQDGFNGSSNTLNLEVSQGDHVIITFVYGDLGIDNAHQIEIEGYGLLTTVIGKANPTSKIEFDAEQVGSFLIHCIIPCVGMENLQNAYLVVKPGSGVVVGTTVALQSVELNGSLLNLKARLTDKTGNALTGLIVNFYVSTDFGMMKIGYNVTDRNGVAQLTYQLASARNMTVAASFPGSGIYGGNNATAPFTPPNAGTLFSSIGVETSPHPGGEGGFFDIRVVGLPPEVSLSLVVIVLIVILSVWSTYAYVIGLILKIKRHNSKHKNGGS
jgi:hypothetical protein